VLAAGYAERARIFNYETGLQVNSFLVGNVGRCAKFVVRMQWVLIGADDGHIHVFNYRDSTKIKEFTAHTDYIRGIEVHPTLPCVLSCSDDKTIKLWNWDRNFACVRVLEGHSHYVMQVKINPNDTNTLASASLDRSIKLWSLDSNVPHCTLEGHERGVNCVDYYPSGDKPYILSGADDRIVKIWDYQVSPISLLQSLDLLQS
jgi:coatomer subunit beta'